MCILVLELPNSELEMAVVKQIKCYWKINNGERKTSSNLKIFSFWKKKTI